MAKIPSYFCEACGTKVDKLATSCPTCGKLFDSIKCPMCAYTGKAHEFPNGCPKCGFMNDEQKAAYKQRIAKNEKIKNTISPEEAKLYKILIGISILVFCGLIAVVIMLMK